jgi:hypothetical protein
MYSRKWNCETSLFSKHNHNVLSPNFLIHVSMSVFYIPRIVCQFCCSQIGRPILGIYKNHWQIHDWKNRERSSAVSFLGIHKSDFWYSVRSGGTDAGLRVRHPGEFKGTVEWDGFLPIRSCLLRCFCKIRNFLGFGRKIRWAINVSISWRILPVRLYSLSFFSMRIKYFGIFGNDFV